MFFTVTRAERKPCALLGSSAKLTLTKTTSMAVSAARLSKQATKPALETSVSCRRLRDVVLGTADADSGRPSDRESDGIGRLIGSSETCRFLIDRLHAGVARTQRAAFIAIGVPITPTAVHQVLLAIQIATSLK